MVKATAEWGAYSGWIGSRVVSGPHPAISLCDEIEANTDAGRVLVGFTSESGHFFAVGLGADDSCAMYWASVDPPYFQSRGNAGTDDVIDFAFSGHHTQLSGTVRIARSEAMRALSEFMETDGLPQCITWDET